ncbi:hypothetical protein Anapl_05387 [Anas platyrhynchos]|uniref:Uncharacterized protein n=1 Tax=Anas platyrhynchos TaxID=8839 RepID=R0JY23_ANAPL|nr:hypothetical protein Anapl_05387 [Anas platyrhynchos]
MIWKADSGEIDSRLQGPDFQGTDSREHFVKSWSQKESLPLLNSIVLTECNQSACQQAISLSEGNSESKHKLIRDAFTANRNNSCRITFSVKRKSRTRDKHNITLTARQCRVERRSSSMLFIA